MYRLGWDERNGGNISYMLENDEVYEYLDKDAVIRTIPTGFDATDLIGRIFINRENQYFVEGKRQISMKHNSFGSKTIDRESLLNIIETAVSYALEFDLLVPPYDLVKIVSVDQMNTKIENSKLQTGKRLGYKFNSNDI